MKRTNKLGERIGRTNRELLRCLTMAAPTDEARLAILGHQERCSRGDSVTALSGAQTGVSVLRKAPGQSSSVRDGIGYGLGVRSHFGLQTVGIKAGTQGRDSRQGFKAEIQGRDSRQTRRSAFAALP